MPRCVIQKPLWHLARQQEVVTEPMQLSDEADPWLVGLPLSTHTRAGDPSSTQYLVQLSHQTGNRASDR